MREICKCRSNCEGEKCKWCDYQKSRFDRLTCIDGSIDYLEALGGRKLIGSREEFTPKPTCPTCGLYLIDNKPCNHKYGWNGGA